MASPSIVILTEPANCQLVDSQLLLEALLQAQQLSREGVPVAQTYCDNPAAAAEFMDAYAKAYPGLELKSTDLPPPDQLNSMLASGQLAPLPTPDGTNPAGAPMLNPLLVLSLGKPDGLLQALQGLRSVRNSINVIEIAPDTEARKVPISVAAAVAAHALADTSWSVETTSASSRHGEEDTLPAADEGANAPLRLDSVEFNLDYIQADSGNGQSHRSLSATGPVNSAPGSAAGGSDAESPAHADTVAAGSVSGMSLAAQPELTAPSTAPASQLSAASAPDPAVLAASGSQSQDAHADATDATLAPVAPGPEETRDPAVVPPDGTDADPHTAKPAEGAPDGPADQSHTDQGKAGQSQADQSSAEPTQASDKGDPVSGPESSGADPKATGPDDQDTGQGGSSFDEPGADVVYAPTGGFTPGTRRILSAAGGGGRGRCAWRHAAHEHGRRGRRPGGDLCAPRRPSDRGERSLRSAPGAAPRARSFTTTTRSTARQRRTWTWDIPVSRGRTRTAIRKSRRSRSTTSTFEVGRPHSSGTSARCRFEQTTLRLLLPRWPRVPDGRREFCLPMSSLASSSISRCSFRLCIRCRSTTGCCRAAACRLWQC